MALSKPTDFMYKLVGAYLEGLYNNPLRTKAITSCILASLANILSQKLSGAKRINKDNVISFALLGLFIGGPVPHYFYTYINLLVKNPLGIFLIERLVYMPCFQTLAIYILAIFELRVLVVNCIAFAWTIYIANKRTNIPKKNS